MITIFAAVEHVLIDKAIDKTVRTEFYTNRNAARCAIAEWAHKETARGFVWTWSEGRWERWIGDSLHVLTIEEYVVHDGPLKEQTFEWTFDPMELSTIIERPSKQSDCMHDNCPTCKGTGKTPYGGMCVHGLVCPCKKCAVTY